jgi:hypothetical protein
VWQFLGIEDPVERGKAIARWKRGSKVKVPGTGIEQAQEPKLEAPASRPGRITRKRVNKHGRKGVKR